MKLNRTLQGFYVVLLLTLFASFIACSSTSNPTFSGGDQNNGDASDGDTSDGDTSDGDASDGDASDGDTPDGDVSGDADLPSDGDLDSPGEMDLEAENEAEEEIPTCARSCVFGEDLPDCLSETELCWCGQTGAYKKIECNVSCQRQYNTNGYCMFEECTGYDRCACIGFTENWGIEPCDLAMCDPGTDSIPCIDYGTPSQPFGVCFDPEGPDCDTPDDFCGGDENHICMAFQNGDQICMKICEPIPNTCNEDTLCIPMDDGITIFGGCLEL